MIEDQKPVTWVHIPGNDRATCESVLQCLCEETQFRALTRDEYWASLERGPSDEYSLECSDPCERLSLYMDPTGLKLYFGVPSPPKLTEGELEQDESRERQWRELADEKRPEEKRVECQLLYIPYVHWEYVDMTKNPTIPKINTPSKSSSSHPRRTLDEAGYPYLTDNEITKRKSDQVMTRHSKSTYRMMVDQLWVWRIDSNTVVTCFPESPERHDMNEICRSQHLECLAVERANMRGGIMDAKRTMNHRTKASRLFESLMHTDKQITKSGGNRSGPRRSISIGDFFGKRNLQDDILAIWTVRDIQEELRILIMILDQQSIALQGIQSRHWYKWENWKKIIDDGKKVLQGLEQQAKDVDDMLSKTLELKQTQLSMRQNEIVLVFTIVTIVFLPLSFLSSIFGMNARELSGGILSVGTIFAYIFPISAALIVIALIAAFYSTLKGF
ncbi:MAG: hypothetical protein M1820_003465 [Bogoriella megaspora]|nr:MAG: hypothetical protein M1820_003465 [Bogoriella megaspora]